MRFLLLFILFSSSWSTSLAQSLDLKKIDDQVYDFNNKHEYQKSQALLLDLLKQNNLSSKEKATLNIYLSYTYKRLFDYPSVIKFLNEAKRIAKQLPKKDSLPATIEVQKAFVYFDTHDYKKSVQLMDSLSIKNFQYISTENVSKLMMQQAYILFLNKKYKQAEVLYDKAIVKMQQSSICDLPMILVKKMQLYDKMNLLDARQKAYNLAVASADSCGIIKYRIYADDELLDIYKKRNDVEKAFLLQKELDSLNDQYKKDETLGKLHLAREKENLKSKDEVIDEKEDKVSFLIIITIALIAILVILYGLFQKNKKTQEELEKEYLFVKQALDNYINEKKESSNDTNDTILINETTLSERQQEVLLMLQEGLSNKEIATRLYISENTVKFHIKNIYIALGIKDRKELETTGE